MKQHKTRELAKNNDDSGKDRDNVHGGNESGPQVDEEEVNKDDARESEAAKDDETEKVGEYEDNQDQVQKCGGKKNDAGNGDDEDHGGGANIGGCSRTNNSNGDEGEGSSSSSGDSDSGSIFFIKQNDSKQQA